MKKIILPGGAGLVGQNLVARLKAKGYSNIIVLDKHRQNIEILKQVQPDVVVEFADLAEPGDWQRHFVGLMWWSCCRRKSAGWIIKSLYAIMLMPPH